MEWDWLWNCFWQLWWLYDWLIEWLWVHHSSYSVLLVVQTSVSAVSKKTIELYFLFSQYSWSTHCPFLLLGNIRNFREICFINLCLLPWKCHPFPNQLITSLQSLLWLGFQKVTVFSTRLLVHTAPETIFFFNNCVPYSFNSIIQIFQEQFQSAPMCSLNFSNMTFSSA